MRALPFRGAKLPLSLLMLTSLALALPAEGQMGVLRRAAERRVGQKVDDQANVAMLIDATFDNTTLELTDARLDTYTAAMEKRRAQAAQNRAAADGMQRRSAATRDSAHSIDNPSARDTYERNQTRYSECRDNVRQALDAAAEAKVQATVAQFQTNPMAAQNDPKMKSMMAIMQEMAAAQARGDAAGTQRAMEKMQGMFGQVTDSAAIDRAAVAKCGARPVKPASMLRADSLNARADSLGKAADGMRGGGNGVSGAEVGMTDVQARMFWERIASWLTGMRKDAPITVTFTRAEYDRLVARRSALRKAFSGSE